MERQQLPNLNASTILNTGTTTEFTLTTYPPSKKEIIQRLFTEGHISFDEMWILILDEPDTKLVPMPYIQPNPIVTPWENPWIQPFNPDEYPFTMTTSVTATVCKVKTTTSESNDARTE